MTQPNPPQQLPTWQPAQIPQSASTGTGPQVAGTGRQTAGQTAQQSYAQWSQGQAGPTGSETRAQEFAQSTADAATSRSWPSNPAPGYGLPAQGVPRKKRWWRSKAAIGVAGAAVVAGSFGLGFATHALVYGGSSSNTPFTQDGSFPGQRDGGPGGGFGNQQGNGGPGGSDEGGTGGSDGGSSSDSGTGTSWSVPQTTATDSTDA